MLKVYGIHGKTFATLRIPTGKASLVVEFKRGRLGLGPNNKAATYSTSDPTEQAIIENSEYYGGLVRLVRSYDGGRPADASPAKAAAATEPRKVSLPNVTTKEAAVEYLKQRGAKAVNLKDDESIAKFAAKIGVTFPNLTL